MNTGRYVYQFDRATGERIKSFQLPANLDVSNLSPVGATEISGNTSGRTANKGMEGLAITPDGKTLVGIMQAALIQDNAVTASKKLLRIVTIDIATGTTHEYGYKLTTARELAISSRSTITSSWSTSATARGWETALPR